MATIDRTRLVAARLRVLRAGDGRSQDAIAAAAGLSQPTYSRVESGDRALRGAEAVRVADALGVRVGALLGAPEVEARAVCAARTSGDVSDMATMRAKLNAYLELAAYLDGQGIPAE
ncbi:MAG TPA: helix-turn-helix transcriptional regulator [Dermatophilaceae bacterium]|jgi:transcriptional regulator with XRE-family HTH domain|nr:helix-turn-helix transcriptional regulator [Dermatophilaceae bacterium]HPK90635.1 helix-turn-helix transcriptional regulator [Dermatophilaceae bacterium]HQH91496.1 helix-turn-helix transcriptional regulator [Dermatophilaceae bacterium]